MPGLSSTMRPPLVMDTTPDAEGQGLVRAFREGDTDAFRTLFARLLPELRTRLTHKLPARFARRLSIADILQEASVVAFQRHRDFTGVTVDDLRKWLFGITELRVRKAVEQHGGTKKRRVDCEVSREGRIATADMTGHQPSPSQVAIGHELRDRAREALASLSTDYREVLRLVQDEGYDLTQVATRLGRSHEAVQKLHERALSRFTEAFKAATRSHHG